MTGEKVVLFTPEQRSQFIRYIGALSLEKPLEVVYRSLSDSDRKRRSLSANALYWVWMDTLAGTFNQREIKRQKTEPSYTMQAYDKEDMHNLCRHLLLGYETIQIRNTVIEGQLRSTAKLNKGEFCNYMEKINAWAVEIGIYLPYPQDSEYARYLEQNG